MILSRQLAEHERAGRVSVCWTCSHAPPLRTPPRWWLGEIASVYEALGDQRNAFRYNAAAAQTDPYAALEAARLADTLGMPDEARRLYQDVLIAWEGGDSEFEPWLEKAQGWPERVGERRAPRHAPTAPAG